MADRSNGMKGWDTNLELELEMPRSVIGSTLSPISQLGRVRTLQ